MSGRERKSQHSGGWGGSYGEAVGWEEFDALPWEIRRLYCFAAYKYTPITTVKAYRAGQAISTICRDTARRMREAVRREALRLYGPSHPQAAA